MKTNYGTTYSTTKYLTAAAECILKLGYIKSDSQEISTKEKAKTLYSLGYISEEPFLYSLDMSNLQAYKLAMEACDWIFNLKQTNDFTKKLKEVCSESELKESDLGIAASLIVAYQNNLRFEAKKAAKLQEQQTLSACSKFQGAIGDKINFKVKEFKEVSSYDTDWGYTFLYQILDEMNNVYIWKTGTAIDWPVYTIEGRVKAHQEYNGIKQTMISRCKVNG